MGCERIGERTVLCVRSLLSVFENADTVLCVGFECYMRRICRKYFVAL